ncbi:MAG TPA: hypothetical protein VMV43_08365 [Candidatus Nanopelagicaceae bacterium]|nr:hypothetical protein [Candidatus Nanopelagicaceae bacterium]
MKKKYRVLNIITLYVVFTLIYLIFFLFQIESLPLFLFLTIGSVAVLSTSTIYTVIKSKSSPAKRIKKDKYYQKPKSIKRISSDLIEDYFEAMPLIDQYADTDVSFENVESIDDYIFTFFKQEELDQIDLLGFSKMDKIFFIREMLYFDAGERKQLIEDILKNKDITDEQIKYYPPLNIIGLNDKLRVYIRSLVEPGEKTKILIIETSELISIIKEQVGILFDYGLEDFLLSTGGLIMGESCQLKDYFLDDDDEIALIPSRKK